MVPPKPKEGPPNPSALRPFATSPFAQSRQLFARPETTRYQIGEIKLEGLRLTFQDGSVLDARAANGPSEISAETERTMR